MFSKILTQIKYKIILNILKCSYFPPASRENAICIGAMPMSRYLNQPNVLVFEVFFHLYRRFDAEKQMPAGKHYSFWLNETRSDCLFAAWKTERQNKRNQVASGFMVSRQLGLVEGCLDLKAVGPCGYPCVKHPIDWTAPPGQKQLQCFS